MEFKCFSDWKQLPRSSDVLFSQGEKDSLFYSRQWFENLAAALIHDESLVLACVVEASSCHDGKHTKDDNVLAILPLVKRDNNAWSSLHHTYTSLFTVLVPANNQQEILNCLAKGLSQLPFDSLTLRPVAENDDAVNTLRHSLESFGLVCNRYFRFFNWFHRVQEQTSTDYMADRQSRVRNTIARKQRKLGRDHTYTICLYTGEDVQQAIKYAAWIVSDQIHIVPAA